MFANQVSKNSDIFCTAETPLKEVFLKMIDLETDYMPVVESAVHRNVIGIITERGICLKLINDELNPRRISAGRVMSGDFTKVSGDTTIEECRDLLKLSGVERLFVVDEYGFFEGVLFKEDLVEENSVVNFETVIKDFSGAAVLPSTVH